MVNERNAKLYVPPPDVCVDNGAMIAYLGMKFMEHDEKMRIEDTQVIQRFRTDSVDIPWSVKRHRREYARMPGAEAVIQKDNFLNRAVIRKIKIKKKYRIEAIDSNIRKERTRREAKFLHEAKKFGVYTPIIYDIRKDEIVMEFIPGKTLFDTISDMSIEQIKKILREIARLLAQLHSHGIAHGDMTTSNLIYYNEKIYAIDFSMGTANASIEEKAVDVHMFDETFQSAHYSLYPLISEFYDEYRHLMGNEVLSRVDEIRRRRRYV